MSTPEARRLEDENAALRRQLAELGASLEHLVAERTAALLAANAQLAREVAERQRAEALLARDALLLSNVRDAVIVTDLDGVVTYWNDGAERVFGWAAAEMLGRPYLDRYPPQLRATVAEEIRRRKLGEPFAGEWEDLHKDGSTVWISSRVQLLSDAAGTAIGIIGVSTDISDRKRAELALRESEQRLRIIFDSSLESMVLTDLERRILAFNRIAVERSAEVFGRSLAIGQPLDHWVLPQDRGRYLEHMASAARGETIVQERRFDLRDGRVAWYVVEYAPALADDGAVIGVCFTARDITAQRQLQEQLAQSQKLDGIGRLAGGVAHDFNNLLVVITGCAELALADLPPAHPAEAELRALLAAAERAAALTGQLLAFARRQSTEPHPLDVNEVIRALQPLFQRLLRAGVVLTTDLATPLPFVRADRGQIEQVLVNLVVNAQDAMAMGGLLSIATIPASGEVEIVVRDTGIGMSEEVAQRAFEPFFTTKPIGEGTGLGLATCYGIVAQHGGRIGLSSVEGKGTTVTVALPAAPDSPLPHSPVVSSRPDGGAERVLLVEDDPAVRALAARVLKLRGYTVLEAASGVEALGLGDHDLSGVELLVTDLDLPQLGGRELAERLLLRAPGLRVLFISGYGELSHGAPAGRPLRHALLSKPFTPDDLARAVRVVLDAPDGPSGTGR